MNYLLILYYTHLITYYTSSLFYYFREKKENINEYNKHITYLVNVFYKHIIFLCLLYSFILYIDT